MAATYKVGAILLHRVSLARWLARPAISPGVFLSGACTICPMRATLLSWYAQGALFFGMKRHAESVLERLVEEYPRRPRAWAALAFLRAQAGKTDQAVAAQERAVELKADAPALFNLGYLLQRAGRHAEAARRLQQAIELDPHLDRAWYGLGLSLAHEGRYEEAVVKFQEAARLQPMNPYAGYQLARAWHRLGQPEKVRTEYERVKGFDPKVAERIRVEFGLF